MLSSSVQTWVAVSVERHEGSVPRERGAWMLVSAKNLEATIGGGHLEHMAIAHARRLIDGADNASPIQRFALGPSLGQCCGGVVWLRFELLSDAQTLASFHTKIQRMSMRLPTLALFGGGHVGAAIVRLCATLPMPLTWIDSRDEIFPAQLPSHVRTEHSDPVETAVHDVSLIPAGSRVLIMSFSHAEDLEVCAACLRRQRTHGDLAFIGLIGSKTKWATFQNRLRARGFGDAELAQITCPIGVAGVTGKEPEVIAVAVAAQLLGLPTMPPRHK